MNEKPWYRSKKFLALVYVGALLLGSQALGAPGEVTTKLAEAIMLALPVLIGGQSWIDGKVRSAAIASGSTDLPKTGG